MFAHPAGPAGDASLHDDEARTRIWRNSEKQFPVVAHLLRHGNRLRGVDVEHALGLLLVPEPAVVAGEARHVSDAVRVSAQDVLLNCPDFGIFSRLPPAFKSCCDTIRAIKICPRACTCE